MSTHHVERFYHSLPAEKRWEAELALGLVNGFSGGLRNIHVECEADGVFPLWFAVDLIEYAHSVGLCGMIAFHERGARGERLTTVSNRGGEVVIEICESPTGDISVVVDRFW